jgi:hypothetical protein
MSAPASTSRNRSRESPGAASHPGIGSGAEAALAQVDLRCREVLGQRLCIRVGRDEVDAGQPGSDHRVDRVSTATSDADHLDPRAEIRRLLELDHLNPP